MRKLILLSIAACFLITSVYSQLSLKLVYTAINTDYHVLLDSIKVMNRTQGCDTILYWPDTILVLDYNLLGINNFYNDEDNLTVFQNYPNPVEDQTTLTVFIPQAGPINLIVNDIIGREVINSEYLLEQGYHSFQFTPGSGNIFFFTAIFGKASSSIKILNTSVKSHQTNHLEYMGISQSKKQMKLFSYQQEFSFNLGDRLLYIGFNDTLQSGIIDIPETSETFTFQFAYDIPCPGTPSVSYEGQVYNTVQIFSQCWLRENLNVGSRINTYQNPQDNNIIEKYCFNDYETYGGLYYWDEMMNYSTQEGAQGICPDGWHIPIDDEWKILEATVDSRYSVGDSVWDNWGELVPRGYDAGIHLKTVNDWEHVDNVIGDNAFGFSGEPGGYFHSNWGFVGQYQDAFFHASNEVDNDQIWYRRLQDWSYNDVRRAKEGKEIAFSVRCIKD